LNKHVSDTSIGNTTKEAWKSVWNLTVKTELLSFITSMLERKVLVSDLTITTSDAVTRRMFVCSREDYPVQKKKLGHIIKEREGD